jgi:hypothetical protein
VEEGSNSPSQESGLNRELSGNNSQYKIISVSDSGTSTGGKEGKVKVKVKEMNLIIKHQKEQRKILGQDLVIFLWI